MEKVNSRRTFISVVMSVYNAETFLKDAIESVLNQTFVDFEFIIINDGSTDKSLDIIDSYVDDRIILIDQKNKGLSKSLNIGIDNAKNNLIARMDADDVSEKTRLQKQFEFMETNPECVLVGSNAKIIDVCGRFLYTSELPVKNEEIKKVLPESSFFHSSTMFRKTCFLEAGSYPEEIFHYFEDKVLWNKMANTGQLRNLPEALIKYRLVPESISNLPHKRISILRKTANTIIANNYQFHDSDIQKINQITTITSHQKLANYHLKIGTIHLKNQRRLAALTHLAKSAYYYPFYLNTFIKLVACLFPFSIIKTIAKR